MKCSQKRIISNDEFEQYYNNIDNKKIINSFIKKYKNVLNNEEIKSCGMIALWKCLQLHDNTKQKFTTSLYKFMSWECLQLIVKNLKTNKYTSLDDISSLNFSYYDKYEIPIEDILSKLDIDSKNIVLNLLNNKKPKEIAKELSKTPKEIVEAIKLIEKKVVDLVYS